MFTDNIKIVKASYENLKTMANIIFANMSNGTTYKNDYCYPFFETGHYYVEKSYNDWKNNKHGFCFLPVHIDDDMQNFINALRDLDSKMQLICKWNIKRNNKEYGHYDDGNIAIDTINGICYKIRADKIKHKFKINKTQQEYIVVFYTIARGVMKNVILDEFIELAEKLNRPLTKVDFCSIQAFTR